MRLPSRKYNDRTFWTLFIVLIVISIVSMFTASSVLIRKATAIGQPIYQPMISHVGFLLFGALTAYIIQYIPSKHIRLAGYVLLIFSVGCLLLTFTSLGVSYNDSARWISILGIQFQPSELAKLSLIIVVSDLLSRIKSADDYKRFFWITISLTGFVCLLIVFSNLSTVLLIGGVVMLMMFLVRIPLKWLGSVVGAAAVILILGYVYVENRYVRPGVDMTGRMKRAQVWVKRVDSKIASVGGQKTIQVTDDNYQAIMAQAAVARGGASPIGVMPGNSVQRDRLPLAFADYIFAIIVEETGIIGAVLLAVIYLWILARACRTSSKYQNYSAMLMVMGLAIMLTTQAFLSMAVAVGLGPVTGQPLPLISRGGTSILITSIYFGIMMAVSREQNELAAQEQQAIIESQSTVPDLEE